MRGLCDQNAVAPASRINGKIANVLTSFIGKSIKGCVDILTALRFPVRFAASGPVFGLSAFVQMYRTRIQLKDPFGLLRKHRQCQFPWRDGKEPGYKLRKVQISLF